MLKSVIFFVTWLLAATGSFGQHVISGVVRDAANQPLSGATVRMLETDRLTVTDVFGRFRLEHVNTRAVTLEFSYVGFLDHTQPIEVTGDLELDIRMEETAILTDAVVVQSTRASSKTPTTYTTLDRESIRQQNFGQDVPFLLNWTPSVVTTSDAGTGIGYTGIRIRGSDPTRINVTINGIPYNDSESAGTFWVDIPDIASSSESIQIQRGVGTSTNGAGAFGASINLQTNTKNEEPYAELNNSFGSFNTRKHTLGFGSGLLHERFVVDGRVSHISSDGYIDRASSNLQSYYFAAGYYGARTLLKAIVFGGRERTYQSWYGVPESRLNNDEEAMRLTAMNEGWNETQTTNLLGSDSRTFNPYQYENQVDNYRQDHYQLHFSQQFSAPVTLNAALHYTPGKGYYEEFRYGNSLADYGLPDVVVDDDGNASDNDTVSTTDLIRRRWLDNEFYGVTYSLNYDQARWNVVLGGGWNRYDGDHFGEILWSEVGNIPYEHRYYFNNGDKRDLNTFLKMNYQITDRLNAYGDLQFRAIRYDAAGIENSQENIAVQASFQFFNPKAGLTWSLPHQGQVYLSYAVANREPVRQDFIDFSGSNPRHETLQNIEAGVRTGGRNHSLQTNFYFMHYANQLVLTGELNDVGAFIRTNAGESYRMGLEVQGKVRLSENLMWDANVTVSRNKIDRYVEVLEDYGDDFTGYDIVERVYRNTDIAFSPDLTAGSVLAFTPLQDATISLLTKYVGRQYLDNTQNNNRSIGSYLLNDIRVSYEWKPEFIRAVNFSFILNNVFDVAYESNGYTWGYLGGSTEYRENYYYPQAGRNVMAMINIRF